MPIELPYDAGDYEPTLLLNKYKKPSLKLGSQI
jgi:hypothetical protein